MYILLFIILAIILYYFYKGSIDRIDASTPIDYTSRGLYKFKNRDYQGAIEDYTVALQNNPNDWIALNNRGNTYSVMLHDAQTNEEKLSLIELALDDFSASLNIKSVNNGNEKAFRNIKSLKRDMEFVVEDIKRESTEPENEKSNESSYTDNWTVEDFKNMTQHEVDDEDTRFQAFQEKNPVNGSELLSMLNDMVKSNKEFEKANFTHKLNKTMEELNAENPSNSIPTNPNAEYGHSFDNPIVFSNVLNSYRYLHRLQTSDNKPVRCSRDGSTSNKNGVMIDKYDVFVDEICIANFYVNCYGVKNSNIAPKGFRLCD